MKGVENRFNTQDFGHRGSIREGDLVSPGVGNAQFVSRTTCLLF